MAKANFIHLHVHTHYSLLDGLTKIPGLVNRAKEFGMPALALTDHGVMYGAIEFYTLCKKNDIKPIIGCEVYIAPRTMLDKQPKIDTRPYHLVLLAKNKEGYKNLIKLVTLGHLQGYYYKPRIDKAALKKYGKGLIGLSACFAGEIPRLILSKKLDEAKKTIAFYKSVFGEKDFYLEVQHHPNNPEQNVINQTIFKLAEETNTKVVLTNDSHYLKKEDQEAHEVLLSVQTGKDFDDKARLSMTDFDLSFISPEEAEEAFKDHPEVLKNTLEVAEKCNLEIELGKYILPKFELPKGENDSFLYLQKLSLEGLKKRYNNDTKAKKQLEYELSVIKKTGFADYFLIVSDLINWAKSQGIIVGPGRGSAAGSITAYCLNITDLEPMGQNLLFERFLNPERISMPDIDIDFADDRRGEVIRYAQKKYGEDHVAQIITFGTMAARGSIRDTGRALGMTYDEVDKVAKVIPMGMDLNESLEESAEFNSLYSTDENVKKLVDMAKKLEGVARHASTHACGVVISKQPLTEYLPLQEATKGETNITTQYSMGYVDSLGLLKIDFLGLSNLTVIKNALRIIKKTCKKEIDISQIPIDDKATYDLLSLAQTTGVFQLESSGMKRYLKQLKPSNFDDIVAMVALYRPGPMEFIPDYINRKHGREKITYLHPKLEPILKNTYGIAVYQEQLMSIARELGGFTMGEADVLRKAVGKKIKDLLEKQKTKLLDGMEKNKISRATAQKIWEYVEPFAAYGFNKSHAACYALIAYQTAYLKAHYPKEFLAALLTSDFGNLDRVAIEIEECNKMQIKVLPPDVNRSFVDFGVVPDKNEILFGLQAIKNVGTKVSERIVENREKNGKYKSLEDFCSRLGSEVINKKTIEALAKSGALDNLSERNQVIFGVESITKFTNSISKNKMAGQDSLFAETKASSSLMKLNLPEIEPASKNQKLSWEREHLGIYLSEHPLDEYRTLIEKANLEKIKNLSSNEKIVKIVGIISSIQKILTKKKDQMIFANLEDTSGKIELLVFPKVLQEDPYIWKLDNVLIVKGRVNSKDGIPKLLVEKAKLFADYKEKLKNVKQPLILEIKKETTKEKMQELKEILKSFPGSDAVTLEIFNGQEKLKLDLAIKINSCNELFNRIDKLDIVNVK